MASEPDLAGRYEARVAQLRRVLALAVELGMEGSPMVELADDPSLGSHQIAILAPFGPLDRQRLLTAPGPDERLALEAELLEEQELLLRARIADG